MQFTFADVHVYEARSNYWAGEVLKKVSGVSLYQTTHTECPWGLTIHCHLDDITPHSVEFKNGTVWSFCSLSDHMRNIEWPMFVKDYPHGGYRARVERLFTDSMYLTITSDNALLNDLLIWNRPPRARVIPGIRCTAEAKCQCPCTEQAAVLPFSGSE